jgi:ABC-type Fe3+ transport system substrate-binding protein
MKNNRALIIISSLMIAGASLPTFAADLPKATQKILKKLKLPMDYLKGTEAEFKMPAAWVKGAKKEGAAVMLSTWRPKQFKKFIAPFKERYPYAKMEYRRAGRFERSMKPVLAFKEGRFVGDILTSFNSSFGALQDNKVLADLRGIPNFKHLLPSMQGPKGQWFGYRVGYWCMAYNTAKVKTADLPKTWEDLLTNPRWRNGKLGLSNSPGGWVLALWGHKGEAWTTNYLTKLFRDVKPQRRNENRSASLRLAMIGEYDAVIPAGGYKVKEFKKKGGAVGFHCPEIVPVSPGPMAMVRNNPHINTAKIFLNWYLTREGQAAMFFATGNSPARTDMQTAQFLAYPKQVTGKGKKQVVQTLEMSAKALRKVQKIWKPLWQEKQ